MVLYLNKQKSKKIYINEEQLQNLTEDVFINKVKGKKANLTYNKRNSDKRVRNMGNYNSFDMLDTGKMDQNNADTFIVPLKGGINSYNITSIKGSEVMHYFKNKFSNKSTNINIKVNGKKDEYTLMMEDDEFKEFLNVFTNKVSNVINYVTSDLAKTNKDFEGFKGISIYPVPSSSKFNEEMAKILERGNVGVSGLPCQTINSAMFKKDLSNLQKDVDFINKNKKYYQGRYFANGDDNKTHIDVINDTLKKYKDTTSAQDENLVNEYNKWIERVITSYYTNSSPQTVARNYDNLVNAQQAIRTKLGKKKWDLVFEPIKYAKAASIDKRTQEIQTMVASVFGKTYIRRNNIPIVKISTKNFQIKNLTNDVRMGLKNYFQAQDGMEEELAKIKGTVFVIFDDNISGGATLSDICYQAKQLGIEYIVPITFGEMNTKYSYGTLMINKPEEWNYD